MEWERERGGDTFGSKKTQGPIAWRVICLYVLEGEGRRGNKETQFGVKNT